MCDRAGSLPTLCSWCEILGIEEEIRVSCGESSTQIGW
jgi:hypothetical protein